MEEGIDQQNQTTGANNLSSEQLQRQVEQLETAKSLQLGALELIDLIGILQPSLVNVDFEKPRTRLNPFCSTCEETKQ